MGEQEISNPNVEQAQGEDVDEKKVVTKPEYLVDGKDASELALENKKLRDQLDVVTKILSMRDEEDAEVMRDRIANQTSWWQKPYTVDEMKSWELTDLLNCHEVVSRVGTDPRLDEKTEAHDYFDERIRGVRNGFPKFNKNADEYEQAQAGQKNRVFHLTSK